VTVLQRHRRCTFGAHISCLVTRIVPRNPIPALFQQLEFGSDYQPRQLSMMNITFTIRFASSRPQIWVWFVSSWSLSSSRTRTARGRVAIFTLPLAQPRTISRALLKANLLPACHRPQCAPWPITRASIHAQSPSCIT
jgi:hypothetical protein